MKMFRSLLVPLDLSPASARVVRRAGLLPLAPGAKLTLLHVVPRALPRAARLRAEADARKALSELAKTASPSSAVAIERARLQCEAMRQQQRRQKDAEARLARLTKREREVCDLVAAGLLNKQIAHELGMSEKTVKVHRGRLTRKLDVDSVAALVRLLSNRETRNQ